MCSQINGDKGAALVLVATGNLVTEKTSLIAALYSEFLSDALGPILTYANLKSSLSLGQYVSKCMSVKMTVRERILIL